MAHVNVVIVRAPGTNCEIETAYAWELVNAKPSTLHIDQLIADPHALSRAQVLTIPGGFSYGDDLSAGKVFAIDLQLFLADALHAFVDRGGLVLGICNGFQVLVKAGLLPGNVSGVPQVTLAFNTSGHYEDRWVHLAATSKRCWFSEDDLLYLPVAHAEGRLVTTCDGELNSLAKNQHVAFRYVDENGRPGDFPINPNGCMDSIAGLTDSTGQVLGLMPHPERNIDVTHHPRWTRLPRDRQPDGLRIFQAAVRRFR